MNIVHLIGNLTRDPELKYTPAGKAVAEFTIAVTEKWKTESGEQKERTAFVGCVSWGSRGDAFAKYHRKGDKACITGKLTQDTWDDKETGKKREKTRVEVTDWEFVNGKPSGSSQPRQQATSDADGPLPKAKNNDGPLPGDDDVPF